LTLAKDQRGKDTLQRTELVRIVLPMLVELPGEPCLVDCTPLFAHVQHSAEIYRSLTAGSTRLVTERIMQDTLEARIAALLAYPGAHGHAGAAHRAN
jgi:hypothetical protein